MQHSPTYTLHKLVFTLDHVGDKILQSNYGISQKRALFLIVLHGKGPMTQHSLAVALGYSDPAVSSMLIELAKEGYVDVTPSPEHGRKRIVSLTTKGSQLAQEGASFLDTQFTALLESAGVDVDHYNELTERIYQALTTKEHI